MTRRRYEKARGRRSCSNARTVVGVAPDSPVTQACASGLALRAYANRLVLDMERQAPRQARPVQEPTHEFQTPGHGGEPGHTEPVHSRVRYKVPTMVLRSVLVNVAPVF